MQTFAWPPRAASCGGESARIACGACRRLRTKKQFVRKGRAECGLWCSQRSLSRHKAKCGELISARIEARNSGGTEIISRNERDAISTENQEPSANCGISASCHGNACPWNACVVAGLLPLRAREGTR